MGGTETLVVEPIAFLDDITIKVDRGGVAFSVRSRDFKGAQCIVTYQEIAGTISPGAHPGSYNGQDAYNDMLVTDESHNDKPQLLSYGGDRGTGFGSVRNGQQRPADSDIDRGGVLKCLNRLI